MIGITKFSMTRPDALAPYARAADLGGSLSRSGIAQTRPRAVPRNPGPHQRTGRAGGAMRATARRSADTNAVAANPFSLMHGLIVMHHIVDDVPADALRNGLSLLGGAVVGPYIFPATQPKEAQP
jgi:hypothetical protein